MLRRMLIGAAALSAVMSFGLASAHADQTQPAQNSSSGDWFRPPTAPANAGVPAAPAAGAMGQGNANGDFPSGQVSQWVDAATRAALTRAVYSQAQIDLGAAIRRAEARFERSRDFQNALDSEQQAYADYLLARQKVLTNLEQNPRHAELLRLEVDLAKHLASGRERHELTHDDIVAMAELKLSYASEARAMEVQALGADSSVKEARDKMVATSRNVASMRSEFDFALPDSAEIATARHNVASARIAMLTASAYLNASSYASSAAYAFANYVNGPTQPRIYNYADPFGYGYGGGTVSPYWSRY